MQRSRSWTALLAFVFCMAGMHGCVMPGGGTVQNTWTEEPVEDARVSLACRQQSIGIGHGASILKGTVTVTSTKDGAFTFSFWDLLGCSSVNVYADKSGFVDATKVHVRYQHGDRAIPGTVYLTPEGKVTMQRLKLLDQPESSYNTSARGPAYQDAYARFFEARLIARTPEERDFVRATFCSRLATLYGYVTVPETQKMRNERVTASFMGQSATGTYDHEAVVVPYCSAAR